MPARLAAYVAALTLALTGCGGDVPRAPVRDATAGVTGIRYLATGAEEGFLRADQPRGFEFPSDHGPHPGFRTEWWYFTGNLQTTAGRHFGFELTFFRLGVAASPAAADSAWLRDAVWMAHLAITDTAGATFFADERLARGQKQLAYADGSRFEVRVEDWSALANDESSIRLEAASGSYGIDLALSGLDRIVLQGDRGYDTKGPEPGNASYYYSAPRLEVSGTLTAGEPLAVSGSAWLDREWGTSALSPGVEGWDWFALQLSDGRDLMYYRLRGANGDTSPFSGGSLTDETGLSRRLGAEDVQLAVLRTWRSPATGVEYPVEWRLALPAEALELRVAPRLDNQELDLSVRYWEGAVEATGIAGGERLQGQGYLELAGYR